MLAILRPARSLLGSAIVGALAALAVAWLVGCATNPATGKSDFVLMSEDSEIALGRKYHAEIIEQYGRYDDPALQDYVQDVGERLAANSHRANLIYRFTLLDSTQVNAFALPGGYIYVTRGMLAHLDSEAELAAVLGHEIGHVTARHSVRQHGTATTVGLVGSVLAAASGVQGAGDLANLLGTAIVRGYGREMELEADGFGAEYLARGGYPVDAIYGVLATLKDQESFDKQLAKEEGREPTAYHGLFATHPNADRRLQEVVGAGSRFESAGEPRGARRDEYLSQIDGLVFGDGEKDGIRRGRDFYHGELGFALRFPEGWVVENRADRLVAKTRDGKVSLIVWAEDLNRRIEPHQFMQRRLRLDRVEDGRPLGHTKLKGYTGRSKVRTASGSYKARVSVLYFGERAYLFVGSTKKAGALGSYEDQFLDVARSFRALSRKERSLAKPLRIGLHRVGAKDSMTRLAEDSQIPHHAVEQLRLINGLYPDGEPRAGQLVKIIE